MRISDWSSTCALPISTGAAPEVVLLDLADLDSVAAAAEDVATRVDRLDILLNNAGVMAIPLRRTAQGHEAQLGTNHLGHFALTGRMLPVLPAARQPERQSVGKGKSVSVRVDYWGRRIHKTKKKI